jgi:hypothetical protein
MPVGTELALPGITVRFARRPRSSNAGGDISNRATSRSVEPIQMGGLRPDAGLGEPRVRLVHQCDPEPVKLTLRLQAGPPAGNRGVQVSAWAAETVDVCWVFAATREWWRAAFQKVGCGVGNVSDEADGSSVAARCCWGHTTVGVPSLDVVCVPNHSRHFSF